MLIGMGVPKNFGPLALGSITLGNHVVQYLLRTPVSQDPWNHPNTALRLPRSPDFGIIRTPHYGSPAHLTL